MSFKAERFSHIDLGEQSSRPGVDGPRYVPIPGSDNLGDTNTGLTVYPRREEQLSFFAEDNTQQRDMISMVGNQVD